MNFTTFTGSAELETEILRSKVKEKDHSETTNGHMLIFNRSCSWQLFSSHFWPAQRPTFYSNRPAHRALPECPYGQSATGSAVWESGAGQKSWAVKHTGPSDTSGGLNKSIGVNDGHAVEQLQTTRSLIAIYCNFLAYEISTGQIRRSNRDSS